MIKKCLVTIFVSSLFALPLLAQNGWYAGQVKRIALVGSDGGFIITFKTPVVDDCKYKYVYFLPEKIGEAKVKNAYAMALTSLTSGVAMGAVIDKSLNGVDGICHATGMAADLRAN